MKMEKTNSNGFTLLEVIITIVLMAIASTMLISVMKTGLTAGVKTVSMVSDQYQIIRRMENIITTYRQQVNAATSAAPVTLANFKAKVIDGTQYVDSANTYLMDMTSIGGSTYQVLVVTLKEPNNNQIVRTILTPAPF